MIRRFFKLLSHWDSYSPDLALEALREHIRYPHMA